MLEKLVKCSDCAHLEDWGLNNYSVCVHWWMLVGEESLKKEWKCKKWKPKLVLSVAVTGEATT